MENRIITFDSLIEYCKTNNIQKFNSKETGKPIIVSTFGNIDISKPNKFSEVDNSLMPITMKACHTGINRNNSKISETTMAKALPSFMNKPILAEIKDGDFGSHAMEYVEDNNGNIFVRYIERAVGIVPESCNAHLEYDKEKDRMYTIVDGYIFNYYGNETSEIIKRKNGTKVSVELEVNEFEWSQEDDCLEILDFTFSGVTLLGESVMEGMEGSRLDLAKLPEIETNYSAQLIEMQSKLDTILDCFNNKSINRKEELKMDKNTVEETIEEVTEVVEEIVEEVVEEVAEIVDEPNEEVIETPAEESEVIETEETVEEVAEEVTEEEPTVEENEETISKAEYDSLVSEFAEYKELHSHTNEEFDELFAYKEEETKKQRQNALDSLFAKFDKKLSGYADYEALKTSEISMEIEDLEEKLFAMIGKKSANFSAQSRETVVTVPVDTFEATDDDGYGGILSRKYSN